MTRPTTPVRRIGPDQVRTDGSLEQTYEDREGVRWICTTDLVGPRWRRLPIEEIEAGDCVTATEGALAGTRLRAIALREGEALVRIDPPGPGGPAAFWAPLGDLAPFFAPGRCATCGAHEHGRCQPPVYLPEVGWRVRALEGAASLSGQGVRPIAPGAEGVVVDSSPALVFGEALERFFFHWEAV